jgi:predicted branched-subunit amino acid permease
LIVAAAAPAAAIFVFGVIYGSLARPLMGAGATMLSSLFIFSGSVQFTLAGLLSAEAGVAALVGGAATLNLRNLALGAVMRPRIQRRPIERAGLAWFLTDEAVGLSLASGADAARILLLSGATFYLSWQAGTALGLLGASVEGVRSAAEAVFPVLFIGLAALSCPSRSIAVRAVVAAGVTSASLVLWPGTRGVAAVVAAIAVALPGSEK